MIPGFGMRNYPPCILRKDILVMIWFECFEKKFIAIKRGRNRIE